MNRTTAHTVESTPIDIPDVMARVEGDISLLDELLGLFRASFPERLGHILEAVRTGDADAVRDLAHAMKGAAASLSLGPLREASADLEAAGRNRRLDAAAALVSKIQDEFSRLESFLSRRFPGPILRSEPELGYSPALIDGPHPVLAVEENEETAVFLERTARSEGLLLEVVHTGRQALTRLEAARYALVLLDINLPDMSGCEVLEILRRKERAAGQSETPVLALTASSFPEDIARCRAAGFTRFLEKPIRRDQLLEVLRGAMGEAGPKLEFERPDESIADLLPQYQDNRKKDLARMRAGMKNQDFAAVESIAHRIKGSGASFGFLRIGEIGAKLEAAARKCDRMAVEFWLKSLDGHLKSLATGPGAGPRLALEAPRQEPSPREN